MEDGKGRINGGGRRLDRVVNTQYSTQMMYYRIAHLKHI